MLLPKAVVERSDFAGNSSNQYTECLQTHETILDIQAAATLIRTPVHLYTFIIPAISQSDNHAEEAECNEECEYRLKTLVNVHRHHQNGGKKPPS